MPKDVRKALEDGRGDPKPDNDVRIAGWEFRKDFSDDELKDIRIKRDELRHRLDDD